MTIVNILHNLSSCDHICLQSARIAALAKDIDRWDLPKVTAQLLERVCWSTIKAPPGIAPSTKRPFTMHSTMNMAMWIGLSKVSGKYLLSQLF